MPTCLHRIIAAALIACLTADPCLSYVTFKQAIPVDTSQNLFTNQALTAALGSTARRIIAYVRAAVVFRRMASRERVGSEPSSTLPATPGDKDQISGFAFIRFAAALTGVMGWAALTRLAASPADIAGGWDTAGLFTPFASINFKGGLGAFNGLVIAAAAGQGFFYFWRRSYNPPAKIHRDLRNFRAELRAILKNNRRFSRYVIDLGDRTSINLLPKNGVHITLSRGALNRSAIIEEFYYIVEQLSAIPPWPDKSPEALSTEEKQFIFKMMKGPEGVRIKAWSAWEVRGQRVYLVDLDDPDSKILSMTQGGKIFADPDSSVSMVAINSRQLDEQSVTRYENFQAELKGIHPSLEAHFRELFSLAKFKEVMRFSLFKEELVHVVDVIRLRFELTDSSLAGVAALILDDPLYPFQKTLIPAVLKASGENRGMLMYIGTETSAATLHLLEAPAPEYQQYAIFDLVSTIPGDELPGHSAAARIALQMFALEIYRERYPDRPISDLKAPMQELFDMDPQALWDLTRTSRRFLAPQDPPPEAPTGFLRRIMNRILKMFTPPPAARALMTAA
jgi:hypothetical protein